MNRELLLPVSLSLSFIAFCTNPVISFPNQGLLYAAFGCVICGIRNTLVDIIQFIFIYLHCTSNHISLKKAFQDSF